MNTLMLHFNTIKNNIEIFFINKSSHKEFHEFSIIFVQFIKFHEFSMIFQGTFSFSGFLELWNPAKVTFKSVLLLEKYFK